MILNLKSKMVDHHFALKALRILGHQGGFAWSQVWSSGPRYMRTLKKLGIRDHQAVKSLDQRWQWTITHRIHVWYIYANIGAILMVNVTIYSSTMDPMGNEAYLFTAGPWEIWEEAQTPKRWCFGRAKYPHAHVMWFSEFSARDWVPPWQVVAVVVALPLVI